jgi:hypothetical protein
MASETTSTVRAWAKKTGLKVSDHGRLPASLLEAYQAANTTQAAAKPRATTKPSTASPSKKPPSSPGRKKATAATAAAAVQGKTPPTDGQELFGDQQSVLRRLTSLEGQVAELLGKLETAARALYPSNNKRT